MRNHMQDNNRNNYEDTASDQDVHYTRYHGGTQMHLVDDNIINYPYQYSTDIVDEIDYHETNFRDSEKNTNSCYIGFSMWDGSNNNGYLLSIAVSANTFFMYYHNDVCNYLTEYNTMDSLDNPQSRGNMDDPNNPGGIIRRRPKIQIMKLHITEDGTYMVSIKTHWIRLIQRHWKNVLKLRAIILRARGNPPNSRFREIHGKWPPPVRTLPGLYGLMRYYNCNTNTNLWAKNNTNTNLWAKNIV